MDKFKEKIWQLNKRILGSPSKVQQIPISYSTAIPLNSKEKSQHSKEKLYSKSNPLNDENLFFQDNMKVIISEDNSSESKLSNFSFNENPKIKNEKVFDIITRDLIEDNQNLNENILLNESTTDDQESIQSKKKRKIDQIEKSDNPIENLNENESIKRAKLTPFRDQNSNKILDQNVLSNYYVKVQLESHSNTSKCLNSPSIQNKKNENSDSRNISNIPNRKITEYFSKNDIAFSTDQYDIKIPENNSNEDHQTQSKNKSHMIKKSIKDKEDKELSLIIEQEKKSLEDKLKDLELKLESEKKEKEFINVKFDKQVKFCKDLFQDYQKNIYSLLSKTLLKNENLKRNEHRKHLEQQKQNLGEYISQRYRNLYFKYNQLIRDGARMIDIWIDGKELSKVKGQLVEILSIFIT